MCRILLFFCFSFLWLQQSSAQSFYFPPLAGNNWDTISPSSLGWCQPEIDSLFDYLDSRNTKAFLVLKDGKIVIEQYFGTFTRDSSWYWASAGKSLTAVLVGLAQQQGLLSIQDTSSTYLGPGWTIAPANKEEKISIWNQLTMTSGLNDGVADPNCTIDTCMEYLADAGTRWAYHNAPYTKLDDVLQSATGTTVNNFLLQNITLSTGISGAYFPINYDNVFISKARSMARFGLLMLNEGNWNGNQILDTAYFRAMTNTSQSLNLSYGYLWWLNGKASYMLPGVQFVFNGPLSASAPADMYAAMGKNGQLLNIVPSQNLIVIRMGDIPVAPTGFIPNFFNDTIWQKLNAAMCSATYVQEQDKLQPVISPNPAKSSFHISLPGRSFRMCLMNLQGQIVWRQEEMAEGQAMCEPDLAAGIYLLQIESGKRKAYMKIIFEP